MRNRNVGPDAAADVLADVVARTTYKDWTISLGDLNRGQGCEGLTLVLEANVPDATGGPDIRFAHFFPVLAANYGAEAWEYWIFECILMTEQHEAQEWFKVDGRAPFFPDHGPGRNPYGLFRVKSEAQAFEAATPWTNPDLSDPYITGE